MSPQGGGHRGSYKIGELGPSPSSQVISYLCTVLCDFHWLFCSKEEKARSCTERCRGVLVSSCCSCCLPTAARASPPTGRTLAGCFLSLPGSFLLHQSCLSFTRSSFLVFLGLAVFRVSLYFFFFFEMKAHCMI